MRHRFGSEELALLAAVRENPHDDTPKLVYADWLEEHGIRAGALVRAYCLYHAEHRRFQRMVSPDRDLHEADEVAKEFVSECYRRRKLHIEDRHPVRAHLLSVVAKIRAHCRAWEKPLPDGLLKDHFWMGFPAARWCGEGDYFLERADYWDARLHPRAFVWLEFVETPPEVLSRCLAHQLLSRCYALSLFWRMEDDALDAVAACPCLRRLSRLELLSSNSATGMAGVAAAVEGTHVFSWWRETGRTWSDGRPRIERDHSFHGFRGAGVSPAGAA